MELSVALENIDYAYSKGAKAVQLTGGEPMLYSHLNEIVAYCAEKGMYTMLASSGINSDTCTYTKLKKNGLTAICLSVNSIDKQTNLIERDHFECTVQAIKNAVECGLLCFVNIVVTSDILPTLDKTVSSMQSEGVAGVCLLKRVPNISGEGLPCTDFNEIDALHKIVLQYPDFVRVENCYKEYWEQTEGITFSCDDAGEKSFFVRADGSVSPCSKLMELGYGSVEEMYIRKSEWRRNCCGVVKC